MKGHGQRAADPVSRAKHSAMDSQHAGAAGLDLTQYEEEAYETVLRAIHVSVQPSWVRSFVQPKTGHSPSLPATDDSQRGRRCRLDSHLCNSDAGSTDAWSVRAVVDTVQDNER